MLTGPSKLAALASSSFSPILALSSATASATVLPEGSATALAASTPWAPASVHGLGDLLRQRHELGVLGDEVGLGGELDHSVAVRGDQAVAGLAVGALRHLRRAGHPQDLDGGVEVAVGLGERLLGVHHSGAGGITELLHISSGDCHLVTSCPSLKWSVGFGGVVGGHGLGQPRSARRRLRRPARRPARRAASATTSATGSATSVGDRLGDSFGRSLGLGDRGRCTGEQLALPVGHRLGLFTGGGSTAGCGPAGPRRRRRRPRGSAARPNGSRRRCPGWRSRPRRDRSWCRGCR